MTDNKTILSQLDTRRYSTQLISDLLTLPELMKIEENNINNLKLEIAGLKRKVSIWEMNEKGKIAREKDKDGKVIYSNTSLREAELLRKSNTNPEMIEVKKKLEDKEKKLSSSQIEYNYYSNRFKSLRTIGGYLGR